MMGSEERDEVVRNCATLYSGYERNPWGRTGAGWHDVIAELSYRLEALNVQFYERWKVRVVASQVKEKCGTLRFYWSCVVDAEAEPTREQEVLRRHVTGLAEEYVRAAEKACAGLCQDCGAPIGTEGSPRCTTLGWTAFLCRDCAVKPREDGSCVRYEMDGKFYCGAEEIPSPFVKAAK